LAAVATVTLVQKAEAATGVYNYLVSGEDWHDGSCETGKTQSPIDLPLSANGDSVNKKNLKLNNNVYYIQNNGNLTGATTVQNATDTTKVVFTNGNMVFWDANA